MKNNYLSIALLCLSSICAIHTQEIDKSAIMVPAKLGALKVFHEKNRFFTQKDGVKKEVGPEMLDSNLRSMNKEKLRNFLTHGYLKVKEWKDNNNNTEYGLESCERLKGGGHLSGAIGWWITTAIGAAATAIATTVTVTAGPVAVGVGTAGTAGTATTATSVAAALTVCPFLP